MPISSREIIMNYMRGRDFAFEHSAEDILARAYNELAERLAIAQQARAEAEKQRDSLVHQRALEIFAFKEPEVIQSPRDPTVWVLRLDPLMAEIRMLSAIPSKWAAPMMEEVGKQISELARDLITKRLFEVRKRDSKDRT